MTGKRQRLASWRTLLHLIMAIATVAVAVAAVSFFPVRHTESPPFASPAFQRTWVVEATAAPEGLDLWGSDPLAWRVEAYSGAPNDRRVVQYFERGRMEVEAGTSRVTIGALALELTRGEIDLGDGVVEERQSPEIPIDAGEINDLVPTYLTLSRFVGAEAENRTGERITEWIDRGGIVNRTTTPEHVRFGEYIEETGHNIPDVTVELFDRPEFQNRDWVESFGYPVSEPFWSEYRRNDEPMPSIVQVFERRILVYTPGLESSQAFTVPNSGRHYTQWRYGTEPHASDVVALDESIGPDLVLGDDLEASVYADELGTPIDLSLSASGHLMILTLEGRILKAESLDPDGTPREFSVWADGIDAPQGMVTSGNSVLVAAEDQLQWFREEDGRGVPAVPEHGGVGFTPLVTQSQSIYGKPIANSSGEIFARTDDNGDGVVLRELGSSTPLAQLNDIFEVPGPVQFRNGDVFLAGTDDSDRSSVVLMPSFGHDASSNEPISVATFSTSSRVHALAVADERNWPISELGEVIVAVQDEEDARLYALSRNRSLNQTEVVELVSGLSRPTAVQVGLDGSVYVADAEEEHVIRIRHID